MSLLDRFKRKVMFLDDSDDSCWIWVGALRDDGRGRIKVDGHEERAHRVAWELLNGCSIPDGMRLRQECGHPQCVRHWRLDPVRLARRRVSVKRCTDVRGDNRDGRACA